ncbi:MAG: hypothetical protein NTZ16_12930, partial [Verrucomicrobia bacterium]|nr:hypothetical protein [Verrucomicrobiota bacterium]
MLLPAEVGVNVGNVVNTPAVKAAEVPVAPAVPPKVTVPVNELGPVLQVLPLESLAVMLVKLTAVPAVADVIVAGFITNWLMAPGFTSKVLVTDLLPGLLVAIKVLPVPAVT